MEVPGKRTDVDDEEEKLENLEKLCELCEADNINTHASCFCNECEEFMCTACFRQHLRAKACRNHTLMDIDLSSETCFERHSRATNCKQHGGEVIKFYCRKHEAVGCGDCMVLGHNACQSEYIKDLSNNFQQNEEYKSFMRKIEKLVSDRKESEQKIQENKEDNKSMLEEALRGIKQFRLDINKHLDKVEEDIISQAVNIMEENETLLTKLANDCMTLSTKLEEITNMLNSELYKDNVLFINTVEGKPRLTEAEKAISNMKSKSTKKYKFVCDEQLRSLVTSAQKLGILAISSSTVFPQTIDRSIKKSKSQGNACNNAEGTLERGDIRNEDDGGQKEKKYGLRSGVRVGARVKSNFGFDPMTGIITIKIWNYDKSTGKLIRAKSFKDLVHKAKDKLHIDRSVDIRVLLEDGCEVDDTECLFALATSESPLSLFVIRPTEYLCLPSTSSGTDGQSSTLNEIMERISRNKKVKEDEKKKPSLTLKMNFGWMNYNYKEKRFQTVRSAKGGGTRANEEVLKTVSYDEIITKLKGIFFPSGKNQLGRSNKYDFQIGDVNGNVVLSSDFDVAKMGKRINLLTKEKSATILSVSDSTSSDDELLLPPPWKKQKQRHSEAQLDFLSVTDDLLQVISESSSTAVEQPTHVNADTPTVSFKVPEECFICRDRPKECFLIPCGHTYCTVCAVQVESSTRMCPQCRMKVVRLGQLRD